MRILFLFLIIIIIFNPLDKAAAQRKQDNPLEPIITKPQKEISVFIAPGSNFTSGEFYVACDTCVFSGATGFGLTAGLVYEHDLSRVFQWGGVLFFDYSDIQSSYLERKWRKAQLENDGREVDIKLDFRQNADAYFLMLGGGPSIKWSPTEWFFFRNSIVGGFILDSYINHTEELVTRKGELRDGQIVTVSYQDAPYSEEGEFHNVNSFQAGWMTMVGFNIKAGVNVDFSPGVMFYLPFTPVSGGAENMNIYKWRAFLELRVILRKRISQ